AWISGESSAAFPRAALIPPSAAPEWLRVGWSLEIIATSAPASKAAMAARMPAQPAATTRTSSSPITSSDATGSARVTAVQSGAGPGRGELRLGELLEVRPEHPGQLARLGVVGGRIAPGRARVEQRRGDARDLDRHLEAEDLVGAELGGVEPPGERRVE